MTKLNRVNELKQKIQNLQEQMYFYNSAVGLIINQQNLLDLEIEGYIKLKQEAEASIRDLRAELADTI